MKNTVISRLPCIKSMDPARATVAMPSFKIREADTTKAAVPNSFIIDLFSTSLIFFSRPFIYLPSALFDFRSLTVSIHSCMPSAHAILTSMAFWFILSCTFADRATMAKDTGSTHNAARAMRQSKKNIPIDTRVVDIIDPKSSGIKCEKLCSKNVQSAMIVLVRSARSFLPKNDRGIFLSFSARVIRLTPLST